MTKAIRVNIGQDKHIYIEVDENVEVLEPVVLGGGAPAGMNPQDLLIKLDSLGQTISDTCVGLYQEIEKGLSRVRPKEIEIEFGVTLGGEAGLPLVTKGTVEAAFKITAKWDLSKTQPVSSGTQT